MAHGDVQVFRAVQRNLLKPASVHCVDHRCCSPASLPLSFYVLHTVCATVASLCLSVGVVLAVYASTSIEHFSQQKRDKSAVYIV